MHRVRKWMNSFKGHPWRYLAFLLATDAAILAVVALVARMDVERVIAISVIVFLPAGFNAIGQARWAAEQEKRVPKAWTPTPRTSRRG